MQLIDIQKIDLFIADAVREYQQTAPQLATYLEDVYERLTDYKAIDIRELVTIGQLFYNGSNESERGWEQPNYAMNRIHHMILDLGINADGRLGAAVGDF